MQLIPIHIDTLCKKFDLSRIKRFSAMAKKKSCLSLIDLL